MKKQTALVFLIGFFHLSLHAQQADSAVAAVHYNFSYVVDTTQPESPTIEKMVLYIGNNSSMYTSYDKILSEKTWKENTGSGINDVTNIASININGSNMSVTTKTGGTFTMPVARGTAGVIIKNNATAKIENSSNSYGKEFFIEESIPTINWQISTDTKNIQGLACQKATARFRGRDYEAWFCSQLPYNNGPWKLGGLPGLIIEASDSKKEVVFTFESFEDASATHTAIEISKKATRTTAKELAQFNDAMKKDREAMMTGMSSSTGGGRIQVSGRSSSDAASSANRPKSKQMNNPIEKEETVVKK